MNFAQKEYIFCTKNVFTPRLEPGNKSCLIFCCIFLNAIKFVRAFPDFIGRPAAGLLLFVVETGNGMAI